ncbi:hypothetical protein [uncultured Weissella sp.]|uniref:hypothetical protein n=1 Tax=uncultured Weissella sp. TaxID=253243 RepID=UPI00258558DA|nr:hypothetical protein [uncultured Weissella sp.]
MALSKKAIALYNFLSIGANGAKTRKTLAELLNVDVRTVSVLSRQLIDAGVPVGSIRDSKRAGLFIIENQDELNKSTYSVENDALESMNRIHKLRGINLDNWYTEFTAQKNQLQNM